MKSNSLLYATNNAGKLTEVSEYLKELSIKVLSPKDLGLDLDVAETGNTLEENAVLKVKAYQKLMPEMVIIADDTGVEIDALNGEPGVHVNRWNDHKTRMSDEEIIAYCLERMKDIPKEKRGAQMRIVIALAGPDSELIETFDGILKGIILKEPIITRHKNLPFNSLFYVPENDKMLAELHHISNQTELLTHRKKAVLKSLPRIKQLMELYDLSRNNRAKNRA